MNNRGANERLGQTCIDGGRCHHHCEQACFRRLTCEPFSDYSGPWKYDPSPSPAKVDDAGYSLGPVSDGGMDPRNAADFAQAERRDQAHPQPRLKVVVRSFPESNGKRNWTALLLRAEPWGGLIGSCGGIVLARSEFWNRAAYVAEQTKALIGLRDTEPSLRDYGQDVHTPEEWSGESACRHKGVRTNGR